jgi:hypothetical protein
MERISKMVWLADIGVLRLDANRGPWCAHKFDLFVMPDGDFAEELWRSTHHVTVHIGEESALDQIVVSNRLGHA